MCTVSSIFALLLCIIIHVDIRALARLKKLWWGEDDGGYPYVSAQRTQLGNHYQMVVVELKGRILAGS